MNEYISYIASRIEQFQKNQIALTELRDWANKEYIKLLQGEFVLLEKLVAYRFIKGIANLSEVLSEDADEFCTINDIKRISDILKGRETITITMSIVMSEWIYSSIEKSNEQYLLIYKEIEKRLFNYKNGISINDEDREVFINYINILSCESPISIIDILNIEIKKIISIIINFYNDRNMLESNLCIGGNTTEEDIIEDLNNIIMCALGKKKISIIVCFCNGETQISLIM